MRHDDETPFKKFIIIKFQIDNTTMNNNTSPPPPPPPPNNNNNTTTTLPNNNNDDEMKKKRKRGLKPRSQRNRKRPRGGVGILNFHRNQENGESSTSTSTSTSTSLLNEENKGYKVQIDVLPLDLKSNDQSQSQSSTNTADELAHNVTTNKRIRIVQPYPYTYSTFAKARWNKRTILDVYSTEFGSYPKSYYESAIANGRITVSGKKVTCDYIIKGGDELSHVVHRHEPAVAICDKEDNDDFITEKKNDSSKAYIRIIHEDEDIIVVDKPSTVPVHPCGGYNFNSLFYILSNQNPSLEGKLYNVHRLDRLTSGLTIVAKSTDVAKVLGKCINDRDQCYKVYLARVKGKFPLLAPSEKQFDLSKIRNDDNDESNSGETSRKASFVKNGEWCVDVDESMKLGEAANTFWITNNNGDVLSPSTTTLTDVFNSRINPKTLSHDGKSNMGQEEEEEDKIYWFNLACPCEIICHKNGVCKAGNVNGKAAQTAFAVVKYDEETDTTVVMAKPMTGYVFIVHVTFFINFFFNDEIIFNSLVCIFLNDLIEGPTKSDYIFNILGILLQMIQTMGVKCTSPIKMEWNYAK